MAVLSFLSKPRRALLVLGMLVLTSISGARAEEFLQCKARSEQAKLATAQTLLQRIWAVGALEGQVPTLTIADELISNAYAVHPNRIVITEQLLRKLSNQDELAFVIAHEIGHLVLHSGARQISNSKQVAQLQGNANQDHQSLQEEIDADAIALQLMQQIGFNPRYSINVLRGLEGQGVMNCGLNARLKHLELSLNQLAIDPTYTYNPNISEDLASSLILLDPEVNSA